MAAEVKYDLRDGVAVILMDRPVANALAPGLRAELLEALNRAAQDDAVQAIVLGGAGAVFSSGVDIAEYDSALAEPWIDTLTRTIESSLKPVVASLHGSALGAGFELALAAHARVVQQGTKLALPEITLGLVPGGGGTQRLPRLVGAQAALEFMLSGRAVTPDDTRLARIFARITGDAPLEGAISVARAMARSGDWTRTAQTERGFSDPEGYQRAVSAVTGQLRDPDGAEAALARCVEAAQLLPFEQGLAFERSVFEDRLASTRARAIRHVYTAERRAGIMPELGQAQARPLRHVVLAGAAPVLAELAVVCLDRGQRVTIVSDNEERAQAVALKVRAVYDNAVARGRLEADGREARLARLAHGCEESGLAEADLVLDTGELDLAELSAKAGAHTAWVVLNEGASTQARAAQAGASARAVALRVYRPAHSTTLSEIAVPQGTAPDVVASVVSYFSGQGRSVLRTVETPGLLGHNVMGAALRAGLSLALSGADPHEVDAAAQKLGFAHGPFRQIEAEGIEPVLTRLRRIARARGLDEGPDLALLADRQAAVQAGRTPGRGFYASEGQRVVADPGLAGWLADWRQVRGADRPTLPDGVPLDRALHAALVNEGARLVAGKAVLRASDIDLCLVKGYGFDRARGGPLLLSDIEGLLGLARTMKTLAPLAADVWAPHPLIDDMVKYGRRFFS